MDMFDSIGITETGIRELRKLLSLPGLADTNSYDNLDRHYTVKPGEIVGLNYDHTN
jgi:hypothetical protein